ncbi:hotdog domain-containing protein [Nocardia jinanensis]|nr:hotdog domain-containing protein [Nocardia jinanensis]
MKVYTAPITHRPERDGTVVDSAHVPFYLAMEHSAAAWRSLLVEACGDLLHPGDLGVVDVSATFTRELFVGEVHTEVELIRLGTSSLGFRVVIHQHGVAGAVITTVLARLAADRKTSVPLSAAQRAALESVLAA